MKLETYLEKTQQSIEKADTALQLLNSISAKLYTAKSQMEKIVKDYGNRACIPVSRESTSYEIVLKQKRKEDGKDESYYDLKENTGVKTKARKDATNESLKPFTSDMYKYSEKVIKEISNASDIIKDSIAELKPPKKVW